LITIKDVEHVAKLAKLALTEEEKQLFAKQLADIVSYIDLLNELNVDNVEPMAQPIPMTNVMRKDEVLKEISREEMLAISPFEEDNFIRVPKITD